MFFFKYFILRKIDYLEKKTQAENDEIDYDTLTRQFIYEYYP